MKMEWIRWQHSQSMLTSLLLSLAASSSSHEGSTSQYWSFMIFNMLLVNTLSNSPLYQYSRQDQNLETILFDNPQSSKSMFNLLKLLSSDNTTFPAIPDMNFAADGPFANHTPGRPSFS